MISAERLCYTLAVLFILLVAGAPLTSFAAIYRATNLGDLPDGIDHSVATGINIHGQVVGTSNNNAEESAFIWDSAGTRKPFTLPDEYRSAANGINNAGHIVGNFSGDPGLPLPYHAFRWDPVNGFQDIHTLIGGLPEGDSDALGINSAGQIVGWKHRANRQGTQGFLWDPVSGVTDIPLLPGATFVNTLDINSAGSVVGRSGPAYFTWDRINGTKPFSAANVAWAINDSGQIVGQTFSNGVWNAYVWDEASGIRELGDFPGGSHESRAYAINSTGQIVGYGTIGGQSFGVRHAALWDGTNIMQDLNLQLDPPLSTDWVLTNALGINDAGQIIAEATGTGPGNTVFRAFLLTPVPEPAGIVLGVVGALFVGVIALRRRCRFVGHALRA